MIKENLFLFHVPSRTSYPIKGIIQIGRQLGNIKFNDDNLLSSRHLQVMHISSGYFIEDIESKNGTKLNGDKIVPGVKVKIKKDDVIELGNQTFIITNTEQIIKSSVIKSKLDEALTQPEDLIERIDPASNMTYKKTEEKKEESNKESTSTIHFDPNKVLLSELDLAKEKLVQSVEEYLKIHEEILQRLKDSLLKK